MSELPKKMRGVFLTGHGGLDKLEIRNNIPVPRPGPYDVLIQVRAAAVNNTDQHSKSMVLERWWRKQ